MVAHRPGTSWTNILKSDVESLVVDQSFMWRWFDVIQLLVRVFTKVASGLLPLLLLGWRYLARDDRRPAATSTCRRHSQLIRVCVARAIGRHAAVFAGRA